MLFPSFSIPMLLVYYNIVSYLLFPSLSPVQERFYLPSALKTSQSNRKDADHNLVSNGKVVTYFHTLEKNAARSWYESSQARFINYLSGLILTPLSAYNSKSLERCLANIRYDVLVQVTFVFIELLLM